MKQPLVVTAGILLTLVSGCSHEGVVTPTAPAGRASTQTLMPKPLGENMLGSSVATGTITMISSTPGSGASLPVRECRFGTVTRVCAEGWEGVFNVSLDRDMVWAVLSIGFFDGDVLCGYAADTHERLMPGQTVTFRPSRISLSDEFGSFPTPCRLPAATTQIVAVLWSDSDWSTQLTQQFSAEYTFFQP